MFFYIIFHSLTYIGWQVAQWVEQSSTNPRVKQLMPGTYVYIENSLSVGFCITLHTHSYLCEDSHLNIAFPNHLILI